MSDINGHVEPLTSDDILGAVERLRESKALGATPSQALVPSDANDRHALTVPDGIGERMPTPYQGPNEVAQAIGPAPDFGDLTPAVWSQSSLPDDWSPLPLLTEHAQVIRQAQVEVAQLADEAQRLRVAAKAAEMNGKPATAWELIATASRYEQAVTAQVEAIRVAIGNLTAGLAYDNARRFTEADPRLSDQATREEFLRFCAMRWPGIGEAGACKRDIRAAFAEFQESAARTSPAAKRTRTRKDARAGSIADEARAQLGTGPTSWSRKAEALAAVLNRRGITP